ncbi:MAG TPA: hypothetical protein VFE12_21940, partial [Acetobacteraceae bacterium]|nr:hypothetical protein [Acetobacteraceae bacterium]
LCVAVFDLRGKVSALSDRAQTAEATLEKVLGEVTRTRIEQSVNGQGINALIEKIAAYAPILIEAHVAKPDYEAAKREMDAVLRAVQAIGADAFGPLQERLLKADPQKDITLQKLLLDAALRADPARGKQLAVKLVEGFQVPTSPPLRWYAGNKLVEADQPLARQTLRNILGYESNRGIDPQHAPPGWTPGLTNNSSGFYNFISIYLRSADPQAEETLLMVLGRAEHDMATLQECITALGDMKSKQAARPIESLYRNPPSFNPMFQNRCLDALASILGKDACPLFSEELKHQTQDLVVKRLQLLMRDLGC